jgi:prolyl oligopeptidase
MQEDRSKKTGTAFTQVYPETLKKEHSDTYHGKVIPDPYHWLEDDEAADTRQWVVAQNKVTFEYLAQIPFRRNLKERLEKLWNYEKYSAPFKYGGYTYFYKNDGLQNQYVVYRQKDEGTPEVFFDPNEFSKDGTTSLTDLRFTKDGRLAAYAISEGGADWRTVFVIDAETKKLIGEPIKNVKFSAISWRGNEGFYYSAYAKPTSGSTLSGKTQYHQLFFHRLGTPQSEDELIFGGALYPRRYVIGTVSEDENWLAISAANSTSGNELYMKDLRRSDSPIEPIVSNFDHDHSLVHSAGETWFILTNYGAPNRRLVKVAASNPKPESWQDVIAEKKEPLSVTTGGGYFFAQYLKDALAYVEQLDTGGNVIRTVELPGAGTVAGFSGKWAEKELYFIFTSYINPGTIYKYLPESGPMELYKKSSVDFDARAYVSRQVFYTSKDGTRIPMMITHKKGLTLDGQNPTLLYGYGGFNISLTPMFSVSNTVWLEKGGVFAVPNLRGGGEYGESWHKAGIQFQKQNVFDDFIAAAEYLIEEGYTSSDYLALHGGSNGGLLVGAVMTQRPELARVALPAVGVLDMLRYHQFTAGAGWAYDYGTAEDSPEMFDYLLGYSPYHNLEEGTAYPATLIMTADHDDRVVPAHSFKFAARLQEVQGGANPALIRIETKAGHGMGKPTAKIIEEQADKWAFTLYNMGVEISD